VFKERASLDRDCTGRWRNDEKGMTAFSSEMVYNRLKDTSLEAMQEKCGQVLMDIDRHANITFVNKSGVYILHITLLIDHICG
jgi:hypothetical protein